MSLLFYNKGCILKLVQINLLYWISKSNELLRIEPDTIKSQNNCILYISPKLKAKVKNECFYVFSVISFNIGYILINSIVFSKP